MHLQMPSHSVRTFALFRPMQRYACYACLCHSLAHLYMLAYMSMHESFLFVCLSYYLLCLLPYAVLAMSIAFICFMPISYTLCAFPSIACLLVSFLCLCMYAHGAKTLGARARSPKCKQKGHGHEHVDMSWAVLSSRFRSLVSPIWLYTPLNPSLPPLFFS